MHLSYKNHDYSYYMDGKQLDTAKEEKDLGIGLIITKDLKVSRNVSKPMKRQAGCSVLSIDP